MPECNCEHGSLGELFGCFYCSDLLDKLASHHGKRESWIESRHIINQGWTALPNHAHGGRHASPATRRGRRTLAKVGA